MADAFISNSPVPIEPSNLTPSFSTEHQSDDLIIHAEGHSIISDNIHQSSSDRSLSSGQRLLSAGRNSSSPLPDKKAIVNVKILIPFTAAGAVIGKDGRAITAMQKKTGTKVKMSKQNEFYPGTTERVCFVTGPISGVLEVHDHIATHILEKRSFLGSSNHSAQLMNFETSFQSHHLPHHQQQQVPYPSHHHHHPHVFSSQAAAEDRSKQVKLIVPNSTAGMIIGKSGVFIRQLQQDTGAFIQISQRDKPATLHAHDPASVGYQYLTKTSGLSSIGLPGGFPLTGSGGVGINSGNPQAAIQPCERCVTISGDAPACRLVVEAVLLKLLEDPQAASSSSYTTLNYSPALLGGLGPGSSGLPGSGLSAGLLPPHSGMFPSAGHSSSQTNTAASPSAILDELLAQQLFNSLIRSQGLMLDPSGAAAKAAIPLLNLFSVSAGPDQHSSTGLLMPPTPQMQTPQFHPQLHSPGLAPYFLTGAALPQQQHQQSAQHHSQTLPHQQMAANPLQSQRFFHTIGPHQVQQQHHLQSPSQSQLPLASIQQSSRFWSPSQPISEPGMEPNQAGSSSLLSSAGPSPVVISPASGAPAGNLAALVANVYSQSAVSDDLATTSAGIAPPIAGLVTSTGITGV